MKPTCWIPMAPWGEVTTVESGDSDDSGEFSAGCCFPYKKKNKILSYNPACQYLNNFSMNKRGVRSD